VNIVFRVDSSSKIGTGHVMRCLTLAKELQKSSNIKFICRNREGNLINKIESEGYQVFELEKHTIDDSLKVDWLGTTQEKEILDSEKILREIKPDLLIVDHYGIDSYWHKRMYKFSKKIFVIDDLANRNYNCDILLDQNFFKNTKIRYKKLVKDSCKLLLGPKYALLRDEFATKYQNSNSLEINRILVYFSGTNIKNNLLKVVDGISSCKKDKINIDIILGKNFFLKDELINFFSDMKNIFFYDFVDNMSEIMNNSDLYIGSAGTTTWERSSTGLPSIVISVAENQIEPMNALSEAGLSFYLGSQEKVTSYEIAQNLNYIFDNPNILKKMRKDNMELVDGKGVSRCVNEIFNNNKNI
jgi:UDP-2,4-diacetamido-2,4,6-trideoxy-beta-L-altropyranose hydrolase